MISFKQRLLFFTFYYKINCIEKPLYILIYNILFHHLKYLRLSENLNILY